MAASELPWRIEETCFNAFPSLKQVLLGDWLLRFADGLSRRANSVNPLRPQCSGIAAAIAAAERLYPAHGQPAIFIFCFLLTASLVNSIKAERKLSIGLGMSLIRSRVSRFDILRNIIDSPALHLIFDDRRNVVERRPWIRNARLPRSARSPRRPGWRCSGCWSPAGPRDCRPA